MEFNERQLQAIEAKEGCYAVLAKAGSGKTSVLVERIRTLIRDGADPKRILVISFSNEAKDTLTARLPGIDVNVKTFHGLAFGIVKKFNPTVKLWEQSWEKEKCILDTLKRLKKYSYGDKEPDFFSIYKWISVQRFNLLEPEAAIECDEMPFGINTMRTIYRDYVDHKEKYNLIEFDDMVYLAIKYLSQSQDVLEKYQNAIEYCMVDEFQDTSKDQVVLLQMLTGKHKNVMVVGDPNQNIYSFRGADSKYLTYFNKYFPGGKFINMNINYRSSQNIVEFSNVIAKRDSSSTTDSYEKAVTNNNTICNPLLINKSDIINYINKYVEDGYNYKDIFILSRTNSELQDFESILSGKDIPYKTYNNKSFLDNPEIKLVLSYIMVAEDVNDNDSFIYVMNRPSRFISKDTISKIKDESLYRGFLDLASDNWKLKRAASSLSNVIDGLRTNHFNNIGEMIKYIRTTVDIDDFVTKTQMDTDNRKENLDKFQKTCESFASVEQLKLFMNRIRTNNKRTDKDKIHLLTAHKSKGMESKIVFVAGMNEGTFPHKNATDIESENRLFYVACTRAEEHLVLMTDKLAKISRFITSDLNLDIEMGDG